MIPPPSPVFYGPPARPRRDTLRRLLWAATPVWSLGFLAWVPSLRAALGRRTAGSWAWFALFAAATVAEVVMLDAVKQDQSSASVGGYIMALMAGGAIHGFLTIPPRERRVVTYLQGFGHQHDYGYVPGPTQPNAAYPLYRQTYQTDRVPAVDAVPPAADADAAEVQAGLRELRETLERGEGR